MFDIFLYTGLRRGDAARLGKQHVRKDVIEIDTEKTGTRVVIPMLPELARSAIGLPHPSGRAAMRMLEAEGFAYEGYVDIFDGGPTMTARTDKVESICNAKSATLAAVSDEASAKALVATGHLAEFRCCFGRIEQRDGEVVLDPEAGATLGVAPGDTVWWIAR